MKAFDYFDLYFVDHHIFRAIYANRHQIAPGVWRSAQPSPGQIAKLAKRGLKTVINLRGERDCGSYRLQQQACLKHGIKLINFPLKSRMVPTADVIRQASQLFDNIEYPVLMHCKSGADRAGLMSVLYLHFQHKQPVDQALRQLSLRYGHFKKSDTGVLDYLFLRYLSDNATNPQTFPEWIGTHYDPWALKQEFRASGWANLIVDKGLRRE